MANAFSEQYLTDVSGLHTDSRVFRSRSGRETRVDVRWVLVCAALGPQGSSALVGEAVPVSVDTRAGG
jgi:hypothetical protein